MCHSSYWHNYSPTLLLPLLFIWPSLLLQLRTSTSGDSLILCVLCVCVCGVFFFKLNVAYPHLTLRFWLWSGSNECDDDRQRLELLEYVFVPCIESSGSSAVTGTSGCLPASITFFFPWHFYLHKCPVTDSFPQLLSWLDRIIVANVIWVEVISETSLKRNEVVSSSCSFLLYLLIETWTWW